MCIRFNLLRIFVKTSSIPHFFPPDFQVLHSRLYDIINVLDAKAGSHGVSFLLNLLGFVSTYPPAGFCIGMVRKSRHNRWNLPARGRGLPPEVSAEPLAIYIPAHPEFASQSPLPLHCSRLSSALFAMFYPSAPPPTRRLAGAQEFF